MLSMNSNTTLIIVTLLIAAGAYWYFFIDTGNDAPLTTTTSDNIEEARFRELIVKLPVSFNSAIFSDPRFEALVDITTQVAPEAAGRTDPFAAISGAEQAARSSTPTQRTTRN